MEYLKILSQNGAILPALQSSSSSTTPALAPQSVPPPPTQGRSFSRPNRGKGGVLAEKERVSKEITASATKRKSLVDPDAQTLATLAAAEPTSARQVKRLKVVEARTLFLFPK